MKHLFRFFVIALMALITHTAFAQTTLDSKNGADASNQGVNYNSSGHSTAWSLLFPSVTAAPSNGSDCVTHGTETTGWVWNFYHSSEPKVIRNQDCRYRALITEYGARCQFYSAKLLLDKQVRELFPDDKDAWPEKAFVPTAEFPTYSDYVKSHFKNLTFEDCVKPSKPAEPQTTPKAADSTPAKIPDPVVIHTRTRQVNVASGLLFATGKYAMLPKSTIAIDKALEGLAPSKAIVIEVAGHTDDVGSDASNLVLSQQRAKTVGDYLTGKGFTVRKTVGYGKTMPAVEGKSREARALNRRVTILIEEKSETKE